MSDTNTMILSTAYQQLQEEIHHLQLVIAALTSERDDLQYHVCPELRARYARAIGSYQSQLKYQVITTLELRFRIQVVQAAINRERTISEDELNRKVNKEYQEFRDAANAESRQYEEAQREQRQRQERERASEERWWQRYGDRYGTGVVHPTDADGATGDHRADTGAENTQGFDENSGTGTADTTGNDRADNSAANHAVPDIKELYRKIVRRLHPDGNPDITEREKELFYQAVQAYKDGDIEIMQEIYDEVFGDGTAEGVQKELTYDELMALRDQLRDRIESLQMEIDSIRKSFPYAQLEFLNDEDAIAAEQARLEDLIRKCVEMNEQLSQRLRDLLLEMQHMHPH